MGAAFSLAWKSSTLNTGPAPPSGDAGCSLSRILQDNPPRKYYLTRKACLGILRRAKKRGKPLPPQLHAACWCRRLISQDNISPGKETFWSVFSSWKLPDALGHSAGTYFYSRQRRPNGCRGGRRRWAQSSWASFCRWFLGGTGSAARGIGYQPECSPTLKAAESGSNMVPSVLCLNDQSGSAMDCSPNMFSTPMGLVRTKEQRHQPLVLRATALTAGTLGRIQSCPHYPPGWYRRQQPASGPPAGADYVYLRQCH